MCFESRVIKNCGAFGSCIEDLQICVCEDGWKQSLEMVFFPFTKDNSSNKTEVLELLPCTFNESIVLTLVIFGLVLNGAELAHLLPQLKSYKRFLRQTPLLICLVSYTVAFASRGADLSHGYIENPLFTVTYEFAFTFQNVSTTVFLSKYISYHTGRMKRAINLELRICGKDVTNTLTSIIPALLMFDFVCFCFFVTPVFTDISAAGILFYLHFFGQTIRITTVFGLVALNLQGLVRDMEHIIDSTSSSAFPNNKFYLYCKGAIPNLQMMMIIVGVYCVTLGPVGLLNLLFKTFEFAAIYIHLLNGALFPAMSFAIGYVFRKNLKLASRLKTKAKTKLDSRRIQHSSEILSAQPTVTDVEKSPA
eukprot:snap_masked-scaffold_1-processed-gene-23.41-mRNA-1 protein AED:1.00 eAED:1.00 QI:0/-1/0/0/-1/1/1/0/363